MPLRRLEAEAMRDAVLAVSGRLVGRLGGRPTPLVSRADGLVLVSAENPAAADRRKPLSLRQAELPGRPARRF